MKDLRNKTIIVIGATGGIGRVCARVFSEAGANVVLSARGEEKLAVLQETLPSKRTLSVPADASNAADIERVFAESKKRFGGVDAVLIAAGSWKQLSIDASISDALALAENHFHGLFLPSFVVGYVAQKFFQEQGSGLVANISSHAAIRPELSGNLTYGPMKAASRHFMLALKHELFGAGVRVTDLEPAIVNTPEATALLDTPEKRAQAVQPEAIAVWLIEHFDDPLIPETQLFDSSLVV